MSEVRHPQKGHAWFPSEWDFGEDTEDGIGGPIPHDPLVVYVHNAADQVEDGGAVFWFSLREVVRNAFEDGDPDGRGLRRMRAGLADLIEWIDGIELNEAETSE